MSDKTPRFPTIEDIYARRGRFGSYPSIAENIVLSVDCWEWTGYLNTGGYGQVGFFGRRTLVHRIMYEAMIGPIPDGLQIDHLCRNRKCVNPYHLEPVTCGENIRRGLSGHTSTPQTHCNRGHPFSGDNIYLYPDGHTRACRACRKLYDKARTTQKGRAS